MNYLAKVFFPIFLSFSTWVYAIDDEATKQIIWEGANLAEALAHVDANTLVVLDLDHTLVRTKESLGSTAWYYYERQANYDKGLSAEQSFDTLYPVWVKLQQYVALEHVAPNVLEVLKQLKQKSAGVMAMTSREPSVSLITLEQLADVGIDFSDSPLNALKFDFPVEYPIGFYNGVLFSARNEKGAVFNGVMLKAKEGLKGANRIQKVLFIDDREDNILSMAKAASNTGLEYIGMRFTLDDKIKDNFDPRISNEQFKYAGEVLSVDVAKKILALPEGKALLHEYEPKLPVDTMHPDMQVAILQQHLFHRLIPDTIVQKLLADEQYMLAGKSNKTKKTMVH